MVASLHLRLLADVAELQDKPYPNITFHINESDMANACLALNTERYGPIHMTVQIPSNFPLSPPKIQMDSTIEHPNIFGSYICASILNTTEGYTPAYTLKGIAIQLLSFFSSDNIEQQYGGIVSLNGYRRGNLRFPSPSRLSSSSRVYLCSKCHFGSRISGNSSSNLEPAQLVGGKRSHYQYMVSDHKGPDDDDCIDMFADEPEVKPEPKSKRQLAHIPDVILQRLDKGKEGSYTSDLQPKHARQATLAPIQKAELPPEILVMICDHLETEEILTFAQAWSCIGRLIVEQDLIRTRELQCFCFKQSYLLTMLGVGVTVSHRGKMGSLGSEFDLLSHDGFRKHRIRRSVQGISFDHWLPLPISRGHWRRVESLAISSLNDIATSANLETSSKAQVLYHFMSDVVVKFNESQAKTDSANDYLRSSTVKSTLSHASEKAIESYFHLFHLLLCLASERPDIVRNANTLLRNFMGGQTSKAACPSLGHLLVAALISEIDMDDTLIKAIIKETVTRNVVWMLDPKGSNMPELAYLEPSAFSEYRLTKTFEAGKTSYRLLMFLRLFQRVAVGSPRKPLVQLRDEAFERHGAPPRGSAKGLADSIKRIHQVNDFPNFLVAMGIKAIPSKENFTAFLRDCVQASADKGYSRMPYTQQQALALRRRKEPSVEVKKDIFEADWDNLPIPQSFFPESRPRGGRDSGRGGGRGRAGGRGRGY